MEKHLGDLFIFLATIDPVTTLALFVGLTGNVPTKERRRIAFRSVGIAAAVLVAFTFTGQILLSLLGVRLESFQLAGGIIFFLFGVQMVFGSGAAKSKIWPFKRLSKRERPRKTRARLQLRRQ